MHQPLTRALRRSRGPSGRALARLGLALTACLGQGCAEPPTPAGNYDRRPGAGCGDLPSECVDEASLWACVGRRWEFVDCAKACAARGGAVGCLATDKVADGARCWCRDDDPECTWSQSSCLSNETVQVCDPDTLEVAEHGCDAVCSSLTPPHLASGCTLGECTCTLAGTPCDPESPPRCEPFALVRCIDGAWQVEPCPCSPGNCDPWGPEGAACDCPNG